MEWTRDEEYEAEEVRRHSRTFSARRLASVFPSVDKASIARVLDLIDGRLSPMEVESAMSWWASCYAKPDEWSPEMKLEAANELLDGYGSERVSVSGSAFAADGLQYVKVKKQPPDLTAGEFNRREC